MPVFEYIALTGRGKGKKGIISAESQKKALDLLKSKGLFPQTLRPVAGESTCQKRKGLAWKFNTPSQSDLVLCLRGLATLLGANLPLTESLESVLEQTPKGAMRKVLAQIKEKISAGQSLSQAIAEHPKLFPPGYAAIIQAGENSGTLELVLERLAEFGEEQQKLRRKLQSALAYPILVLLVSLGVLFFLMTYVVPKVTQIFLDFQQALPLPTRILIFSSDLLKSSYPFLGLIIVLAFLGYKRCKTTAKGKLLFDRLGLRLPVIGELIHQVQLSRFCHTLGILLQNEVPLLLSLNIVKNVVQNTLFKQAVEQVTSEVSAGHGLTIPLSKQPIFPKTMVQLISAGERGGDLASMFLKVAANSENLVTQRIELLTSILEPLLILFLGGIVGFVVLAVLLPIFDMSQLIH